MPIHFVNSILSPFPLQANKFSFLWRWWWGQSTLTVLTLPQGILWARHFLGEMQGKVPGRLSLGDVWHIPGHLSPLVHRKASHGFNSQEYNTIIPNDNPSGCTGLLLLKSPPWSEESFADIMQCNLWTTSGTVCPNAFRKLGLASTRATLALCC